MQLIEPSNKGSNISLSALESEIEELEEKIKKFEISEDYHEIKNKADEISWKLDELANEEFSIRNTIKNIDMHFDVSPDLQNEEVLKLYDQAKIEIGDMVKKTLSEVLAFHKAMVTSRTKRLQREKKIFQDQLKELEKHRKKLSGEHKELLSYLNNKGALEEFLSLNRRLKDLENKQHNHGSSCY